MEKSYLVKNRSASVVVYVIPEEGIRREFMPGESKRIEKSEFTLYFGCFLVVLSVKPIINSD